ncbi:ImmA/IrrE family metallo-endopeptidase [Phytohabitans suffuscus]|uniref:ImmA/IrrE family metallo-endopeptidase n=1 Tax=Phytohabitans suffuscus TaxID=624315 RepID=A0A6F8YI11_9ACTN|nr:ImmA/IrrE family metallo-endopeptidase [Phytohabitans suffuscus]BCB85742.1 ImmA/IrrE family metallo-endopeptidase [Phytohabitans suffuscus]
MIDEEIEQHALGILREFDALRFPVPIEAIAEAKGAVIARNHFSGTESGFALRQGRTKIIGVNTATSPRRQRFTIAHELGHLELHAEKALIVDHSVFLYNRDDLSSAGTDRQEIQANAFAAAILMPDELVHPKLQHEFSRGNFDSRDELIARMARAFDVSNEAMGYRLINLNYMTA